MPTITRNGKARKSPAAGQQALDAAEISRVAYELFERRGGAHGNDQDDWFEAERIVRARQRSRRA